MRRKLAIVTIAAVAAAGGTFAVTYPAFAAEGCTTTYTITNQWPGGFGAQVEFTNTGDPLTSWNLGWDFGSSSQTIMQMWQAIPTQTGTHLNAKNESYDGTVATNGKASFGFNGTWSGSNPVPTNFTLNGVACNGGTTPPPNQPPTVSLTSPAAGSSFTAPATVSLAANAADSDGTVSKVEFYNGSTLLGTDTSAPYTFSWTNVGAGSYSLTAKATDNSNLSTTSTAVPITVTTSGGGGGGHLDNPYTGAKGYVNPEWAAEANAEPGGSRVSGTSTAVWLDRIAAINGADGHMGLRAHLDAALAQSTGGTPVTVEFVIYDLPDRDCAALASNGELTVANDGINKYKTLFIDPIAAIMADPKYASLRIVNVVEDDSLPNLVTNLNLPVCAEANSSGAYVQGIQYALNKLHAISNVYNYLDIGHHAWLGWDSNFGPAANLLTTVARGTTAGFASVDGFISNTANYSALTEPYFTIATTVNGTSVRQSKWVDWNMYVDELSFTQAFRNQLIADGFPSTLGMLIDTSRNGWGGAARPGAASTSTDVNTFVNDSRIDRRIHAGNWCNQSGAGLGERPRATPATGIDAYVWIKPPGESDGASQLVPNDQGKGFDRMCDPTYTGNSLNGNNLTGALPNSPLAGAWFSTQFQQLMQNAYPAL